MMGVYIRGMEMPERCGQCFLRVGNCKQRIYMEQRPKGCPLVEIPTPHGRLIDGDAYIKMMEEKCDHELSLDEWVLKVCRGGVSIMPTVIEAEGSETDAQI